MKPSDPGYVSDREAILKRLSRIEGQVRGVKGMVEDEAYCIDVLTQLGAITKALDGVGLRLLSDHTDHCVRGAMRARLGRRRREGRRADGGGGALCSNAVTASAAARRAAPPKVPLPKGVQTLRFLVRPAAFMEHWRAELGETFHASVHGPGELVFISDPASLKALFGADRINTIAPGRNLILSPLLGPGSLLLQEGDEHLRRRKLMLPPFHGERMQGYREVIASATERAVASWPVGRPFSLHPSMQAITLEVILRAVFGITDDARRDELSAGAGRDPRGDRDAEGGGVHRPRPAPSPRSIAGSTPCEPGSTSCLRRRLPSAAPIREIDERDDILSMLVAARFEDGSRMEDAELRDQLMTLLLAGHETTATALAWTFDLLFHRPDAMERLVSEVREGDAEYLDAVIEESLRVRPVVAFTGRELREPAELGGYRLEPGTVVMAAISLDPHARGPLSARAGVPARALPGGGHRDLFLDSLRRRHPALHRRGVRPARDAGRAGDDPALVRPAAGC